MTLFLSVEVDGELVGEERLLFEDSGVGEDHVDAADGEERAA